MNIAIIRRNGLGDLLCAYPLILFLQKRYFDCSITLFLDSRNASLIPYLPPVKEVVVFPESGNKYWNLYWTSRKYYRKFDVAISAKTSPMKLNNFFLFCLNAKERIAYVNDQWHARLINHPIPYDPFEVKKMHQALKTLRMVAPELEEVPQEFYPTLSIPLKIKKSYLFEKPECPVILVSATTTHTANRLSIHHYAALLNRLYQVSHFCVKIVGQKQDFLRAHGLAEKLHMPVQVHFPRNFDEFMVFLETSDIFFVGDGGVAHIGAALNKAVVALYGATHPDLWRPLSKKAEVFFHPHHVDELSMETILQALERKVEEISRGRRTV